MKRPGSVDNHSAEPRVVKQARLSTPSDSGDSTSRTTVIGESPLFVPGGKGRDASSGKSGSEQHPSQRKMDDLFSSFADAIGRFACTKVEQERARQHETKAENAITIIKAHMADFPTIKDSYNKDIAIRQKKSQAMTKAVASAQADLQRILEKIQDVQSSNHSTPPPSNSNDRPEIMKLLEAQQERMSRLEEKAEAREKRIKQLESALQTQSQTQSLDARIAELQSKIEHRDTERQQSMDRFAQQLEQIGKKTALNRDSNDELWKEITSLKSKSIRDVSQLKTRVDDLPNATEFASLKGHIERTLQSSQQSDTTRVPDIIAAQIKDLFQANNPATIGPVVEHLRLQIATPILDVIQQARKQMEQHITQSIGYQQDMQDELKNLFTDLEVLKIEHRDANPEQHKMTKFEGALRSLELRMDVLAGPVRHFQNHIRPPQQALLQNGAPSNAILTNSPTPGPASVRHPGATAGPPGPSPGPPPGQHPPAPGPPPPHGSPPGPPPGVLRHTVPTPPQRPQQRPPLPPPPPPPPPAAANPISGPVVLAAPPGVPNSPQALQQAFAVPPAYRLSLQPEHWETLAQSTFDMVHQWFTAHSSSPEVVGERLRTLATQTAEFDLFMNNSGVRFEKLERELKSLSRAASDSARDESSSAGLLSLVTAAINTGNAASSRVDRLDERCENLRARLDALHRNHPSASNDRSASPRQLALEAPPSQDVASLRTEVGSLEQRFNRLEQTRQLALEAPPSQEIVSLRTEVDNLEQRFDKLEQTRRLALEAPPSSEVNSFRTQMADLEQKVKRLEQKSNDLAEKATGLETKASGQDSRINQFISWGEEKVNNSGGKISALESNAERANKRMDNMRLSYGLSFAVVKDSVDAINISLDRPTTDWDTEEQSALRSYKAGGVEAGPDEADEHQINGDS
ncbi:hypothetical protein K461DRAFT_290950 [Myriangium duriaei CBS 260.36]|uniref:Uncharacterized protein n=1 Tax=Myriangium duriaei CBS 260.36 TaxID=1168546 RepID=A0A9P4MQV9_9PEZI|nr:hypothetical protein K461DRAFT_290950 [Myriangium duriaei CBS 260.36]